MSTQQPLRYFERPPTIYPKSVKGRFRMFKSAVLFVAFAVYFLLPYVRWDRGAEIPGQAVFFDIAHRTFYIFTLTAWPQDFIWLALLLFLAALVLFFVTGVMGRAWCGYFCFQTLWTDFFIMIEYWVQGDRNARMKLDKAPWGTEKLMKKGVTEALYILVAFLTAFTFVAYFKDVYQLWGEFFLGQAGAAAYVAVLVLTITTYAMAARMREQVCFSFCPYGRFQGAMFEPNTLIIGYDFNRGEPRHKPMKGLGREERQEQGHGECIDCGYCVQVCPTGVDIRKGLQYQCISCGLCIDACDKIMDSLNWPRGLVRYTSENALAGRPTNLFNFKSVGYGLVLLCASVFLLWKIGHQAEAIMDVAQERQPLFVRLSDGNLQNKYEIRVSNRTDSRASFSVALEGFPSAEMRIRPEQITVPPGERGFFIVHLRTSPTVLHDGEKKFQFLLQRDGETMLKRSAKFLGPGGEL